jgi:hypothetical protein
MSDFVELRVHGVSGTSAESLLGVKDKDQVDEVAGDKYVRFVRPKAGSEVSAQTGGGGGGGGGGGAEGQLEGMSWGNLTSGSALQATWLLLLPFALINLAYWARTEREDGRLACAYRSLVRILGLSLTAMIVFTAASASMDLVGWQCAIGSKKDCLAVHGWLAFIAGWSPGQVLAVAALVPALTIAALALLSLRTSLRYESFRGDVGDGHGTDDPQLFSRRMWQGDRLVGRLRTLHLGVGLATATAILACASLGLRDRLSDGLAVGALCVAGLVLVACVVLSTESKWLSWAEPASEEQKRVQASMQKWVPRLVLGLALLAFLLAEVASLLGSGQPPVDQGHLGGIIATGHVIVIAQIVLLVLLLLVMPMGKRKRAGLALWGIAGWFLAALGVLLGFAYSAAVVFRVSDLLTGKVQGGPCQWCSTFDVAPIPAPAFEVAAIATGVFVAALVVLLAILFWKVRTGRDQALAWVKQEYSKELGKAHLEDDDYRVQRAVRARAFASAVSVDRFRPILLAAIVVGLVGGLYAAWDALRSLGGSAISAVVAPSGQADTAAQGSSALARLDPKAADKALQGAFELLQNLGTFLQGFGTWAMAGLAAGLVALGGLAWRNEKARRTVGIIWDLVSFFPRAGHPLAPPCYAERAVPQLVSRVVHLVGAGQGSPKKVVLAGHSQGSLLAVAAIAQLAALDPAALDPAALDPAALDPGEVTPPDRVASLTDHVALLTFGSPLIRLYAPLFPRLFGSTALDDLPVVYDKADRWINLWRRTDPIGGTMTPVLKVVSTVGLTLPT